MEKCFIGVYNPVCVFSTTYITCPAESKKTLGIKLPFLVMIIKNMKKYFTFEVQVHSVTNRSAPYSTCVYFL